LQRQVIAQRIERAQRRKLRGNIGREQLIDVFGAREVFEAVLAEVAKTRLCRQCALHQIARCPRDEYLAAVTDRKQARDPIKGRPEVIVVAFVCSPRVDRRAHA